MKPKKYNKQAQPEQLDHYGPTGPMLSGDANSGSQVGFGGSLSGNPSGGVNDVVNPENPQVPNSGNIYLNDNESV